MTWIYNTQKVLKPTVKTKSQVNPPFEDGRKKLIDIGDEVAIVLGTKYCAGGSPEVVKISRFESEDDYKWDYINGRWEHYVRIDLYFEGRARSLVRSPNQVLKLEK